MRTCLGIIDHGDLAGALPVIVVGLDEGHDHHDEGAEQDGYQIAQKHGVVLRVHPHVTHTPHPRQTLSVPGSSSSHVLHTLGRNQRGHKLG